MAPRLIFLACQLLGRSPPMPVGEGAEVHKTAKIPNPNPELSVQAKEEESPVDLEEEDVFHSPEPNPRPPIST